MHGKVPISTPDYLFLDSLRVDVIGNPETRACLVNAPDSAASLLADPLRRYAFTKNRTTSRTNSSGAVLCARRPAPAARRSGLSSRSRGLRGAQDRVQLGRPAISGRPPSAAPRVLTTFTLPSPVPAPAARATGSCRSRSWAESRRTRRGAGTCRRPCAPWPTQ